VRCLQQDHSDTVHLFAHRLLLALMLLILVMLYGCGGETGTRASRPSLKPVQAQADGLSIRLTAAHLADASTPGVDPGWLEYQLQIENRDQRPVMIRNVKLLTPSGRYLDSAADYGELAEPPDVAADVAEQVALRGASIAAGQFIPFGGSIVGILSGAASAVSAQDEAKARRAFNLQRIKNVELAADGQFSGSAFLPWIAQPRALVIDWARDDETGRVELPLPASHRGEPE
jgi:hypothetical protein